MTRRQETIKFLTVDELKSLLAVITNKRDRALFLIAYRHGLRASEVGLLHTADLDLKLNRIHVHRLKGSLSGVHPLQPDEAKALKAHLRSRKRDSPVLAHRFPTRRSARTNRSDSAHGGTCSG